MYYLAVIGFFVTFVGAYVMGVNDGRYLEQRDEARRRSWQYRIDEARRSK